MKRQIPTAKMAAQPQLGKDLGKQISHQRFKRYYKDGVCCEIHLVMKILL